MKYLDNAVLAELVAKWTINSDDQWECAMMVYDPDAECYVWEATVPSGYTSDHDKTSKLFVEKNTGYAEITNSKPDAPAPVYGSLALSKLVYLDNKLIQMLEVLILCLLISNIIIYFKQFMYFSWLKYSM